MNPRVPFAVAALLAVAGLLTGCGSSASAASAGAGAASSPAASVAASTSSAAPSGSATAAGGDFCGVVKENLKEVTGDQMTSLLTGGTPAAWKAYLAAVAGANQQLVDAAPAEIRASIETLQTDSAKVQSLLAAAGYDVRKVDTSQLIKDVSSPEHLAAAKALTAYVKANCGIDLSKPAA